MPEEVRRRAFEPFFTMKPTGAGTGLGLSMVYGFVKQSGGNIQIYSELERGTSVGIFLPLADAVHTSDELAPGAEMGAMPRGSETILVVEDDARVCRVTIASLRSLGYGVIEADNGVAALTLLAAHPGIAMIFTDIVMPGGRMAVNWPRRRYPKGQTSRSCSHQDMPSQRWRDRRLGPAHG
jgi:hypothetical protein